RPEETDSDFRAAESRLSEAEGVREDPQDSGEPQGSGDRATETGGTCLGILKSQSYQRRPVAVLRRGYGCSYCTVC
ncbi:hypothetical protein Tco_0552474, partial [Tanacetum coccineum]